MRGVMVGLGPPTIQAARVAKPNRRGKFCTGSAMTTVVMKFGGTSVANVDRIRNVALQGSKAPISGFKGLFLNCS